MSVTQATTIDRQPVPAGITRPENFSNGKPVYGGVNDPRMGSLDRREPCKTCGCTYNSVGQRNRVNECPGHFGHIEVSTQNHNHHRTFCGSRDNTYLRFWQQSPTYFIYSYYSYAFLSLIYTQMAKPVYHVGFVDDVLKILRCVCFNCSRLMLDTVSPPTAHSSSPCTWSHCRPTKSLLSF